VDSAGVEGDGPSFHPSISADGRYVAFDSAATELLGVGNDTNGKFDIFVHDRDYDEDGIYDDEDGSYDPGEVSTVRVSVDSAGNEGSGHSYFPSISADGNYVAFQSQADDLVVPDTNVFPFFDIFVRDVVGGTTTLASVDSAGDQGIGPSSAPSVSADGNHVAFDSDADLVATDSGAHYDIFVRDRLAVTTTRASVDSAGVEGDGPSFRPSISADGRYVAFDSAAKLVATDSGDYDDIFVHDRDEDEDGNYDDPAPGGISTVRVSVASGGGEANGDSSAPSISADGRYVAFESIANNLLGLGNDNNGKVDIFVHDRDADGDGIYDEDGAISTVRVSVVSGDGEANGDSFAPSISADGKYVVFESQADLVADDSGLFSDIFVYEREDLPPKVDSTSPANNANGVGVGAAITATFSKPMNGSTIDTNTFTLDNGVTGTVTYDANSATATFTPTSKLDYDTTYTATITTAAKDLAGLAMSADYTWSFTTKSEKNNSGGRGPCFIATAASDWADF